MKTRPTPADPKRAKAPSCGDVQGARPRENVPCEIAPFSRNNYYTGKLLTERELTAEQRYHADKLRLHHMGLHGWGAVCGLRVVPHPNCPSLNLVVEPGLAIDGGGREIYVRSGVPVPLPKAPPPPASADPCPPDYAAPKPSAQGPSSLSTYDVPDTPPPDGPATCPDTSELYVRIRYVECDTEYTPAPFDECSCNGDGEKPGRIVESFVIDLLDAKPKDWDEIAESLEECVAECEDLYGESLSCCPKPCWPAYIPLAVVRNYTPGAAVTADMIDDACRPTLPSTRRLDQLVRCILDKLPVRTTTRIRDFNWTHDLSCSCGDFHRWFVEDHHGPRHFEVAFSGPVVPACLTSLVFQATVVRHDRGHEAGGFFEAVPASVWAEPDGSKFYLRIDRKFAEHCLRGVRFDLYLTLHCDLVVDGCGFPVDGELRGRLEGQTPVFRAPTGDGIPGGTFKSWIRVHP
jgi:hypothetical protein